MYCNAPGSDFQTTDRTVTFNATLSNTCVNIPTFIDQLIEDTEAFRVRINSSDLAITLGDEALVLIMDQNSREALVMFNQPSYQVIEGEVISVCVSLTLNPLNLERDVEIMLSTVSGDATGKLYN